MPWDGDLKPVYLQKLILRNNRFPTEKDRYGRVITERNINTHANYLCLSGLWIQYLYMHWTINDKTISLLIFLSSYKLSKTSTISVRLRNSKSMWIISCKRVNNLFTWTISLYSCDDIKPSSSILFITCSTSFLLVLVLRTFPSNWRI